jgi:hypothetical protein
MSEQAAEQPSVEQGSLDLGVSPAADAPGALTAASSAEAAPVSEPVASEPSNASPAATPESPKADAVEAEAKSIEASAPASRPEAAGEKISQVPSKVIVMPRGERSWADHDIHVEAETAEHQSVFGMRRIAAIAAVLTLATTAGAVGGALATASLMHGAGTSHVASNAGPASSLEASLSRIDSDIQALRSGLDHTSKLGMNQFNKTSERLDKLERSQAEPAAKLAKLSEAVDKMHALPVPPPAIAAAASTTSSVAKETTGSIPSAPAPQQVAAVAVPKTDARIDSKADVKSEVGRLPTVEDWVLREVAYGGALIGGRRGVYEVYAGDYIPGLGRVDAIRRQDGRWVVVTSRGLIVAR